MSLLARFGMLNTRNMSDRSEPVTPVDITRRAYRIIVSIVGGHNAARNALLRTLTHLRSAGTPDHLLMTQALIANDTGDFSHLRAEPGRKGVPGGQDAQERNGVTAAAGHRGTQEACSSFNQVSGMFSQPFFPREEKEADESILSEMVTS